MPRAAPPKAIRRSRCGSRSVTGPYVPDPANPILTSATSRATGRIRSPRAGHAQLVETPAGWWATFLAVRPYAGDFYSTGRETFLLPVRWESGWPRITDPGQAIPYAHARPKFAGQPAPAVPTSGPFTIRDDFSGTKLPAYWMMMRNPAHALVCARSRRARAHRASRRLGDDANPSFLARRQQHTDATAETLVRFAPGHDGDRAGLVVLQNDDYWTFVGVAMQAGKRVVTLESRNGPSQPSVGVPIASAPLTGAAGAPLRLRVRAKGAAYAFDYATIAGRWKQLGTIDGTMLSTKTAGGFVGAVFGVYAHAGQ
ncbi:MAG: family 43 glycosylhydrolase [Sphingomonas sp.]